MSEGGILSLVVAATCVSSLILGGVLVDNKWENRMKHDNIINVNSKYYKMVEVTPHTQYEEKK